MRLKGMVLILIICGCVFSCTKYNGDEKILEIMEEVEVPWRRNFSCGEQQGLEDFEDGQPQRNMKKTLKMIMKE